jgi:hypothetical protein
MTISHSLKDDLCHKLRLVGLPRDVVLPLVNSITLSVSVEGPENVVKRLKVLKQAAVNQVAGVEIQLPWIRHNLDGPKGHWRPVWKLLKSKRYKHRKRALNAMMVYASLVLPKRAGPTPTQERKFLGSVSYPRETVWKRTETAKSLTKSSDFDLVLEKLFSVIGHPFYVEDYPDFKEWIAQKRGSDERRLRADERQFNEFVNSEPGISFKVFPEVQEVLGKEVLNHDIVKDPQMRAIDSSLDSKPISAPDTLMGYDLAAILPSGVYSSVRKSWKRFRPPSEPIGMIGSTQEPGLKFRAFASPHMVLQAALDPLKNYLLGALKHCPWDCTHDQDSGVAKAQEWLKQGFTVHSVDLSDATNNFPLDIQLKVLESFHTIPASTVELLRGVSRAKFKVSWSQQCVAWNVGQPLGAGPSFPAFALGHASIALLAEVQAGLPWEELGTSFLILGDDIVIKHDHVHKCYRDILDTLMCPISESKCLSSGVAFEFAGKLATKDHIFHGFKYKEMTDLSFMPMIRSLGLQAISKELLTEQQWRFCQLIKNIPEPLGLGFNPKGESLAKRYELSLHLKEILDSRKPESKRVSSSELINRTLYTWSKATQPIWDANPNPEGLVKYFSKKEIEPTEDIEPQAAEQISAPLIMEMIRETPLFTATVASGDPRPNPLQGKIRKVEDVIAMAVNRLNSEKRQAKPESPCPH